MNNTLVKGLSLLETLARNRQPMGVSELATALGMPKSGAHRLLQALVEKRFVTRHKAGTYAVAIKLWELGSAALAGFDLRRHAEGVMETLMQQTGETVHLSVLDMPDVVYLHKVESLNPVRAYSQIGGRAAAHCVATGKIMLAFQSPTWLAAASQRLHPHTDRSVTHPQLFLAEMEKARRAGYAFNRGEWRLGVNGVAAPILDSSGVVIAAIGISGPDTRLRLARMRTLAPAVCEAARVLGVGLGESTSHGDLLRVINHWG
jgi:DNA-binding IclR family transcriptional regulator